MKNLKILYKYTTKSRRNNFIRGIESIVNNSSNDNYHILISIENEEYDPSMYPFPELNCNYTLAINPGKPNGKIAAINRDINEYIINNHWDILINMSDDMIFIQKGFDDIIREEFKKENTLDLFLHFPDGNNDRLTTMSIIGKQYYDRDKYIYHPSYISLWCDNEAQEVAVKRNCYKFVNNTIFNHLHPGYGKGENDEQYNYTESFSNKDHKVYLKRKRNNFNDEELAKIKWSILIPTLYERELYFNELYNKLLKEIEDGDFTGEIEIVYLIDDREKTTGTKRNELIDLAKGKYISFFDDDDEPINNYISTIMEAISTDSDVIPVDGYMTTNEANPTRWEMALNNPYVAINDSEGKLMYLRYPNHLAVMKRELILPYRFQDVTRFEDVEWATRLHNDKVFKTETRITKHVYHYKYRG